MGNIVAINAIADNVQKAKEIARREIKIGNKTGERFGDILQEEVDKMKGGKKGMIKCKCCGKKPSEISEYVEMVEDGDYKTADEAVIDDEGTYNSQTGLFYCTSCYIKIGMPNGKA